jgi:hypothetical protein
MIALRRKRRVIQSQRCDNPVGEGSAVVNYQSRI